MSATVVSEDKVFTGYRVSPVDILDIRYALVAPTSTGPVPDEYDTEADVDLPIYQQGEVPSCAGWTGAGVKTAHEWLECDRILRFNGLDLYEQIALPCDHGIAYGKACGGCGGVSLGGGAFMRDLFKAMQKTGVLAEDGARYKIGGYAGINPKNHDEVKHALVTTGQLAIGFSVPRSFMQGGGKEFDVNPGGGADDIVGGHAIRVRGYTPEKVIWPNTWGLTWDGDGVAEVSWEFWDKYVTECWTVLDVNNDEIAENLQKRRDLLNLF